MDDAEVPRYTALQMVFGVFTKHSECPSFPRGRVPGYVPAAQTDAAAATMACQGMKSEYHP